MTAGRQALGRHVGHIEYLCEPGRIGDRSIELQVRSRKAERFECSASFRRDVAELRVEIELAQLAGVFEANVDIKRAGCNDRQSKVLEHPAEIRMLEIQGEIRAIQGIETAEAAIDVELQPLDRSLHLHADVSPGEQRIDGSQVSIDFRPVFVELSIAGDRQQAVSAGFYS